MASTHEDILMHGVLVECGANMGTLLTDDGALVSILPVQLKLAGFKTPPQVGDRIHFWADEIVTVEYKLRKIRLVEPQAVHGAELSTLEREYRRLNVASQLKAGSFAVQKMKGTVETVDPKHQTGTIRSEDGDVVEFSKPQPKGVTKTLAAGMAVSFQAVHLPNGWVASRITPSA